MRFLIRRWNNWRFRNAGKRATRLEGKAADIRSRLEGDRKCADRLHEEMQEAKIESDTLEARRRLTPSERERRIELRIHVRKKEKQYESAWKRLEGFGFSRQAFDTWRANRLDEKAHNLRKRTNSR